MFELARPLTLLVATLVAVSSCADPQDSARQARPAMATDIPVAITTPNTLETRLGTLNFFDGFPDDATVEAVYDNLDFQRGVQAFLAGLPSASMYAMGAGIRSFGPPNETVLVFETLMDSRSLFLTPNTESVYMMIWMDLSDGPLVVETPPNVLGIVDDAWFHYVADFGNIGPDRGEGGRYLMLPPGYEGPVPDGYHVARSHTYGNWFFWRGFLEDGSPAAAVEASKSTLQVYPLGSAPADRPQLNFVNVSGVEFNTIHAMDYTYWEELNYVVQGEPSEGMDPETLGLFASIGIRKGQAFDPDARMKAILTEAAAVGSATARTLAHRPRDPETFIFENSAWSRAFVGGSHEFLNEGVRLLDARSYFHFVATGITPAMALEMVGAGSQYTFAFVDAQRRPLDGGRSYHVHLPPNIPAADFWSLVVYDNQTRSMLQTDAQFPSLGSQKEDLVVNDDTSVDLYFGPEPPPGMESNWVQTIPGKGFNVIFRLYGPLQPWFDKTWKPGEFEETN